MIVLTSIRSLNIESGANWSRGLLPGNQTIGPCRYKYAISLSTETVLKKQQVLIISRNKVCNLNKLLKSKGNVTVNRFMLKLRNFILRH